ncbi:MAG: type IX secretion system membrane protein PorP/SprF [Bacteroidetes bacterium]|nr:type IX secretion system membrane protein PorP/SprF [Bacteroidota bacterium]
MLRDAYTNPLALNPSYAGGSEFPALYANYSQSWISLAPFQTYNLSMDIPLSRVPGGFGFRLMNDNVGNLFNHTEMEVMYAYSFKLGENLELRPGAGIGINDINLDVSRLNFGDQMNPRRGTIYHGTPNDTRPTTNTLTSREAYS